MHATDRRRALLVALGLLTSGTLVAAAALPAEAATTDVRAGGVFAAVPQEPTEPVGTAVTYRPDQVPAGAEAAVHVVQISNGRSMVTLHVRGLLPDETYGAHVHYRACGRLATDAGAHYQNTEQRSGDETTPSTIPAYANPDNEVWLDLVTNAAGNGRAQSVVGWHFRDTALGAARSVVLHLNHTATGATDSGVAGARLACLTVGL